MFDSKPQIYLASQSPRRAELLQQLGVRFTVLSVEIDEQLQPRETPRQAVMRLARNKALAVWAHIGARRLPVLPVLGADTLVYLDQQTVLGKPRDTAQAFSMLQSLAGRTHEVISAVCVVNGAQEKIATCRSSVEFAALSDTQIQAYIDCGESLDKAGAYAVQGRAAGFIRHISGSYSGIMGLPLYETAQILEHFTIEFD